MIRTLWFYVVLLCSSVVHATGVIVAALLGVKRRPGGGGVYDWGTNDWSRQVLRAAGTPVYAEGLERIPDRPVVYAANHSSVFDIWALAATLPGSVRMVAKQELARIPLVGWAMVRAGHIMIDRAHPARALEAYDRAAAVIRSGVSALVFPEGTRSRTGDLLPFKNAPFGLAIAAQVPVVPLYVANTFEIMPKGGLLLHPRPIRIAVGEPIATTGMTLERRQELRDRVRAAVVALKARVDAGAAPR
ncbi:MAG TPA: lysophospholipid acyltransferase family protein [Gemmatimonadales bacterium]|nr:lysophospholipid acyltransferase family protein [Gemmatimonadales bacterium]